MILKLRGSLGDEVALTALVREIRLQRPKETIHVECNRPELFHLNPHVGKREEDDGQVHDLVWASDHTVGNLVYQYAKQLGVKVYDTAPKIFLEEADVPDVPVCLGKWPPKVVAIDIWAGWFRRRWPFERFQELVDRLRQHLQWMVIEVGASTPDFQGKKRDRLLQNVDGCEVDKRSVRQTAAILRSCDLFIGADAGLAHVAAAVGTPQIVIYAVPWYARAYRSTYPLFSLKHPMCGCQEWCDHGDRMAEVTVDDVMETIKRHGL